MLDVVIQRLSKMLGEMILSTGHAWDSKGLVCCDCRRELDRLWIRQYTEPELGLDAGVATDAVQAFAEWRL